MEILRCMDMFLITKIPVYILFNPCAKVTQCAYARLLLINIKVHPNPEYSMNDDNDNSLV